MVGLDGLMGSDTGFSTLASDPETAETEHGMRCMVKRREFLS